MSISLDSNYWIAYIFKGSTFGYEGIMATSLKLDDTMRDRIQQLAALRDRSAHWIMREAIRQYVEREEARESFKAEALASWAAYQETGRHLTGQEAAAWLNSWGSEGEGEAPECHG